VLAYARRTGDDHVVVALNLSNTTTAVDVGAAGEVLVCTTTDPGRSAGPLLRLAPHEAVVIDMRGLEP
jgi:hypothetical protein